MASNFLTKTQELRTANPTMSAVDAARQARSQVNIDNTIATGVVNPNANLTTRVNNIAERQAPPTAVDTTQFQDSTGVYSKANAQNAITSTYAPTAAPTPIAATTTPTIQPLSGTPNTQGNVSTIKGGANVTNKTSEQIVTGQTNKVLGESVNTFEANKTTDRVQLENQKIAAEAAAMATDTELKRYQAEKIALADEENRIQQQKANDDANTLSALQEKERAANEASIAAAKAKGDAAERDLSIANDVELQKSNVAFAKLGLTLSTAAVTQAQQIFTTGVYNLSKLKSDNGYKLASLEVEVQKVEFDHTTAINKIINGASEKSYTIRKQLNDDTNKIKNSIIDNRLTRQKNIDTAIDTYQKAIQDNEDEVLNKMQKANTVLSASTKAIYDTLKTKEEYGQDKINTVATNGKWFSMTPQSRLAYEKSAGLQAGTVIAQIKSEISKGVVKGLEGIPLKAGKLNGVISEALQLMEAGGIPMPQAIQAALLNNSEYRTQIAKEQAKKNKVTGTGGAKAAAKPGFVDTVKGSDGKWYNRYKDAVTGKITQEETISFDEGGKLTTVTPPVKGFTLPPVQ